MPLFKRGSVSSEAVGLLGVPYGVEGRLLEEIGVGILSLLDRVDDRAVIDKPCTSR